MHVDELRAMCNNVETTNLVVTGQYARNDIY